MLDIQAIYLREHVSARAVRAVGALSYPAPELGVVKRVLVDGIPTVFLALQAGRVLVTLPAENTSVSGWDVVLDVLLPDGTSKNIGYPRDILPEMAGLLQVSTSATSDIAEIWINGQVCEFVSVSPTIALCALPTGIQTLDSIDILVVAPTLGTTTAFTYKILGNLQTVSGQQKLVMQFVKLLLTTVGSDAFHPGDGGNLQAMVGSTGSLSGANSLAAMVIQAVSNVSNQIIVAQSGKGIPADERLLRATVGSVTVGKDDPSQVNVSLRIDTFASKAAVFSFLASASA